ncbi:MAG: choice-of-anchor J domain-containing protein, partial [Bacteroidota bacterium]
MKKVFTPTRLILVVLVLGSFAFSNLTTEWFPQWTPKPLELESLEAELSSMCDAILLSEDFQAQAIPAGWTNLDLDMAADVNARPMDFYIFESLANPLADGSPNFVAAASSWFNPPGASNNWLITPPLTICANDFTLSWDSAPFEGPAFMDGYTVQISTTDANPNSFNDVVFTVAEGDNIGNVGPGTPHTNFMGTNGLLQSWEVDLSSYNGSTIYIAFVHQTNDDNLIMFDNIQVARNAQVDVTVANGQPFPAYRTIPF